MISAIETIYNGYKFRSRLEARWAVFFDAAKVKYKYEPQGFVSNGFKYLPDFYLPDFDVWVEVKPDREKLYDDAEKLAWVIDFGSTQISHSNGLLILGEIPYYERFEMENIPAFNIFWWDSGILSGVAEFICADKTILNINKDCFDVSSAPELPDTLAGNDLIFWKSKVWSTDDHGLGWQLSTTAQHLSAEKLRKCYLKARQARFEYGETP